MGTWEHLKIGGSPPGIMPQGSCAGGDPSKYTEKYKSSHIFGSIEDAWRVFDRAPTCDVAMMLGYVKCGKDRMHWNYFTKWNGKGWSMEVQVYLNLKSTRMFMNRSLNMDASVHYEGLHYFDSMSSVHWISARVEHCACLVHPFGRAGHLDEVEDVVKRMPCEPDTLAWSTVLAACRVHCNVEMGEPFANWVLEIDPGNAVGYVLLSNIYAAAGKWDNLKPNIQWQRLKQSVDKAASSCTWIEVNDVLHTFVIGDQEHPQLIEFCGELESLVRTKVDPMC